MVRRSPIPQQAQYETIYAEREPLPNFQTNLGRSSTLHAAPGPVRRSKWPASTSLSSNSVTSTSHRRVQYGGGPPCEVAQVAHRASFYHSWGHRLPHDARCGWIQRSRQVFRILHRGQRFHHPHRHLNQHHDRVSHRCLVRLSRDEEHIFSGTENTLNLRRWDQPPNQDRKDVVFDDLSFWKKPSVFVALSSIDIGLVTNSRIKAYVSNVSKIRMTWPVGSYSAYSPAFLWLEQLGQSIPFSCLSVHSVPAFNHDYEYNLRAGLTRDWIHNEIEYLAL